MGRIKKAGPGRPPLPQDLKNVKLLTKDEVKRRLSHGLTLTTDQLEAIMQDKTRQGVEQWIANIILMGIKHGDHLRMNFMCDRLIGKVSEPPQQITINVETLEKMSDREIIQVGKEAIKLLEAEVIPNEE